MIGYKLLHILDDCICTILGTGCAGVPGFPWHVAKVADVSDVSLVSPVYLRFEGSYLCLQRGFIGAQA